MIERIFSTEFDFFGSCKGKLQIADSLMENPIMNLITPAEPFKIFRLKKMAGRFLDQKGTSSVTKSKTFFKKHEILNHRHPNFIQSCGEGSQNEGVHH